MWMRIPKGSYRYPADIAAQRRKMGLPVTYEEHVAYRRWALGMDQDAADTRPLPKWTPRGMAKE